MAADHLVQLGHKKICLFAGEPYATTGHDRSEGFIQRCAELGVDIPPHWIIHSGFDTKSGRAAGELLFSGSKRSEEHTSELQSLMRISYAVFCLKKKKK